MDKSKKSQWLTRYEKQFEFARQVWETSTGKTYEGTPQQVIEIEHKMNDIGRLINGRTIHQNKQRRVW